MLSFLLVHADFLNQSIIRCLYAPFSIRTNSTIYCRCDVPFSQYSTRARAGLKDSSNGWSWKSRAREEICGDSQPAELLWGEKTKPVWFSGFFATRLC